MDTPPANEVPPTGLSGAGGSAPSELWLHMANVHSVKLLESEETDIRRIIGGEIKRARDSIEAKLESLHRESLGYLATAHKSTGIFRERSIKRARECCEDMVSLLGEHPNAPSA